MRQLRFLFELRLLRSFYERTKHEDEETQKTSKIWAAVYNIVATSVDVDSAFDVYVDLSMKRQTISAADDICGK